MTAEDTLRVIHDWYGMRGDWTRVPELAGPEYIRHEPAGTRTVTGEQVREELNARGYTIQWEYTAFAEGDIAFVTWVARNTPQGDMSGVQAYRVACGKLVETWLSGIAPVAWELCPVGEGDPDANKALLRRWYEEMYEQRRFAELAPQLCGPVFTRHEAEGSFNVTAEQHADRLATAVAAIDAAEGRPTMIPDYRVYAAGDRVGVIANARRGGYVQTWRVEDGRFVESWWAGFAQVNW